MATLGQIAEDVAKSFVHYYTNLINFPENVHRFYKESSILVRREQQGVTSAAIFKRVH
ncbi:hypothetical protein CCACVL1_27974 [Corchorus capsularis]|uniref:NTF2 domain-containing protein n=1 Tax=Corchorus capsularis TaxID=210143 RepID=A0A1R3G7Y3_COCAP|nr:hypothetical protein CCACVL1_27974 [Corchorus capsularis]